MTLDKESWNSPKRLLAKFDANNDGLIDFEEFKSMCLELFGPEEVGKLEYRVRDIFEIFDVDEDGTLNQEEWERCAEILGNELILYFFHERTRSFIFPASISDAVRIGPALSRTQ